MGTAIGTAALSSISVWNKVAILLCLNVLDVVDL